MTDVSKTIGELDTLRRKHGATSDIGGICSNLIEQIKSLQKEEDRTARERLTVFIADQQERLARLLSELPNRSGEG